MKPLTSGQKAVQMHERNASAARQRAAASAESILTRLVAGECLRYGDRPHHYLFPNGDRANISGIDYLRKTQRIKLLDDTVALCSPEQQSDETWLAHWRKKIRATGVVGASDDALDLVIRELHDWSGTHGLTDPFESPEGS